MPILRCAPVPMMLVMALVVAVPAQVTGQAPGSDDSGLRKAQAYLTLAGELFRGKDYQGALAELRRAEPLVINSEVHAVVRFNIARCLDELQRRGDAYRAYQRYLELSDTKSARRDKARVAIDRLRGEALGSIRIKCTQERTSIVIPALDDTVRSCPYEQDEIIAGEYIIAAALQGYEDAAQTVTVEGGGIARVSFDLVKREITAPPEEVKAETRWGWIGSGLGVGVLGLGFHVVAYQSMIKNDRSFVKDGDARDEILGTFRTQRTVAYGSYAVSAVLIGVGYYLSTSGAAGGTTAVSPTPMGFQVRF